MADIRILSAKDIKKALSMKDAIDAMRRAFTVLHENRAQLPQRIHMDINGGTALFMPAGMQSSIGIKTVTLFPENTTKNLPFIQGTYCLFDGATGTPIAFMDAGSLTAMRTGAACGLATDLLARGDSETAAILGAGVQGRTQLRAVLEVRSIKKVHVFDPLQESAQRFADEMSALLEVEISTCETADEAIAEADIICAATVSSTPVFSDTCLKEGAHLNAIGSYKPEVQEIPEQTVLRSKLIVDNREAALDETGDLIIPISKGLMTPDHIHADLGELVTGAAKGRSNEKEITFFKSVGLAIQDLAAAESALAAAKEQDLGTIVDLNG